MRSALTFASRPLSVFDAIQMKADRPQCVLAFRPAGSGRCPVEVAPAVHFIRREPASASRLTVERFRKYLADSPNLMLEAREHFGRELDRVLTPHVQLAAFILARCHRITEPDSDEPALVRQPDTPSGERSTGVAAGSTIRFGLGSRLP